MAVSAATGGWPRRSITWPEAQVVGPEVVPPLRDAVGLVDHEQRDPGRAEPLDHRRRGPVARGTGTGSGPGRSRTASQASAVSTDALGGVDDHRVRGVGLGEPVALVALQRDQRRDHQHRAVHPQPGHLVDGRLAGPGREHREHVAAAGQLFHGRQLLRAQLVPAERVGGDLSEFLANAHRHPVPGRDGANPAGGRHGGSGGRVGRVVPGPRKGRRRLGRELAASFPASDFALWSAGVTFFGAARRGAHRPGVVVAGGRPGRCGPAARPDCDVAISGLPGGHGTPRGPAACWPRPRCS